MNLLHDLPDASAAEVFERLPLSSDALRIERIVSQGQATPPGQWYDQDEHEWILLLKGSAGLRFEDEDRVHILKAGDCLEIPAHRRHRVEWTHPVQLTLWLAVFYSAKL